MDLFPPGVMLTSKQFYDLAEEKLSLSRATAWRYLTRATMAGFVVNSADFYSAKK